MLLKNREDFEVPKKGPLAMPKDVKFPAVFKLAPRLIKYDKKNKRKAAPRSFGFDPFYVINVDGNQTEIRYYKHRNPRQRGNVTFEEFTPGELAFDTRGELTINVMDKDMFLFLYYHPRNSSSPYKDEKKAAWFYLENKEEEASVLASKKRKQTMAENLIWDDRNGLSEDALRELAKSYKMQGVDSATMDQVRLYLDPLAKKDPEQFVQDTHGANIEVKALIQDAVDFRLIAYKKDKKRWYTLTENGKTDDSLCEVRMQEDHYDRLVKFMVSIDDTGILEYLKEKVAEKQKEVEKELEADPVLDNEV
jgi:hypothetical protein